MRILHRDDMRMRLRCESDDDLWTLAQFVQPGQRFGMVGERRDSTTGAVEGGRAKAAERRTMWILLDVISVEHHTFSDALRVHGTIVEAAFDQGQHHTHVVEAGHEVEVHTNTAFRPIDVQLIQEAASAALRPKVALVVVEHDEVILFTVAQRGLKEGMTWTMRGGGKRNDERTSSGVKEAFLTNTAKEIAAALVGDVPVVLAGPGHARDRLAAALRVCAPDLRLTSVATSIGGRPAANEVIREGLAGAVLADHAVSRETGLVEEAMTRIQTSGAVAYGMAHLSRAVDEGAVETLVVLADLLRGEDADRWQQMCEAVHDLGGAIVQCSRDHDAGAQLDGLGGAVALTRYRVD
ncbi:MAG: hypothetical protein VXX03_02395 [Candidatus Thermoplasmatota archaeon]|nr:hypothetical protein [Candidatus Thermoplasmatota archaeon]